MRYSKRSILPLLHWIVIDFDVHLASFYLYKNGYPGDYMTREVAVMNVQLWISEYLYKNGCSCNFMVSEYASKTSGF